jgi:hypothetical protein
VQYLGTPSEQMRLDPVSGQRLDLGRFELLTRFTDPDAYVPILDRHPQLKLCLAHWRGAGDWQAFLDDPWDARNPAGEKSWLVKVTEMIASGSTRFAPIGMEQLWNRGITQRSSALAPEHRQASACRLVVGVSARDVRRVFFQR